MIRLNLSKQLKKLEIKEGRKVTLKELADRSGCDRNVLSRIQSNPKIIPSAGAIDKLVQFFFSEVERDPTKPHLDRNRVRKVINELVTVYPDYDEFWQGIPISLRENPKITTAELWQLYTSQHAPEKKVKEPQDTDTVEGLKSKLLEAQESRQEGADIELTLTTDEFDLLLQTLPKELGGKR